MGRMQAHAMMQCKHPVPLRTSTLQDVFDTRSGADAIVAWDNTTLTAHFAFKYTGGLSSCALASAHPAVPPQSPPSPRDAMPAPTAVLGRLVMPTTPCPVAPAMQRRSGTG